MGGYGDNIEQDWPSVNNCGCQWWLHRIFKLFSLLLYFFEIFSQEKFYKFLPQINSKLPSGSQQTVENSQRDGTIRPLYLSAKKPVCRSRNNSSNWTWNNGLVPNWERSILRLCIILSPCLFNFYVEYIMWNASLDES